MGMANYHLFAEKFPSLTELTSNLCGTEELTLNFVETFLTPLARVRFAFAELIFTLVEPVTRWAKLIPTFAELIPTYVELFLILAELFLTFKEPIQDGQRLFPPLRCKFVPWGS